MPAMIAKEPASSTLWSRWGIVITAAVLGSAMVLNAWASHRGVKAISRMLYIGHGEELARSVRRQLPAFRRGPGAGLPTATDLAASLDTLAHDGLRYIAIVGRDSVESGSPLGDSLPPATKPRDKKLVEWLEVGDRVRMIAYPPRPPRPSRSGPPRDGPPRDGHASRLPPRRGAPAMVIEYVPIASNLLLNRSRRTIIISAITALLLMLAALVAFRLLKRREELDRKRQHERHLATLGQMSAVLAHEVRNPLASLKGHSQLLAEVLPDGRPKDKAERVVREAIRLEELINDLLAFVRTGTIHRASTDPVAVVRVAADDVQSGTIEIDDASAPATWSLDPDRMQQVLTNLLQNAVQASEDEVVSARIAEQSGHLVYEVRDRGAGIEPGKESVIFEPFHTGRVHGTGLGLAVAKRVVDLHGGSIDASNHPDGGAVFRILIPRAA